MPSPYLVRSASAPEGRPTAGRETAGLEGFCGPMPFGDAPWIGAGTIGATGADGGIARRPAQRRRSASTRSFSGSSA